MTARTYRVIVHHDNGTWWTEIPDLPGCFASARTLDELADALNEAISTTSENDARLLLRITELTIEIDPDVRPTNTSELPYQQRQPRPHPEH